MTLLQPSMVSRDDGIYEAWATCCFPFGPSDLRVLGFTAHVRVVVAVAHPWGELLGTC